MSFLDWGVASRALGPGESGDRHLVAFTPRGALIAAMDGLGHGPEAAFAADVASRVLERHAAEALGPLLARCHAELKHTRGVAMTLAAITWPEGRLTWIGVGNVEGRLLRSPASPEPGVESTLLLGGVIGFRLPEVRPRTLQLTPGDVLILATDGIAAGFADHLIVEGRPQEIADRILRLHRRQDDALALVVRYGAAGP
ncbi:MAG: SpoIIE family protein phosphatase [Actinomycetota bacterium]